MSNPFGSAFAQMTGALSNQANAAVNRRNAIDRNNRANAQFAMEADRLGYNTDGTKTGYGEQLAKARMAQAKALQLEMANKAQMSQMVGMRQDAQMDLIKSQLEEMNNKLKFVQDKANATDMTKAIVAAAQGEHRDAKDIIDSNPVLKQHLRDMGVNDIAGIDWDKDRDLFTAPNVNLNGADLSDPKVRKAMDSMFMKVQDATGKWQVVTTEEIAHETNTKKYMKDTERRWMADRYTKIARILNGNVVFDTNAKVGGVGIADIANRLFPGIPFNKLNRGQLATANEAYKRAQASEALSLLSPEVQANLEKEAGSTDPLVVQKLWHDKQKEQRNDSMKQKQAVESMKRKSEMITPETEALIPNILEHPEKITTTDENELNRLEKNVSGKPSVKSEDVNKNVNTLVAAEKYATNLAKIVKNTDFVSLQKLMTKGEGIVPKMLKDFFSAKDEKGRKAAAKKLTIKMQELHTEAGILLGQFVYSISGAQATDEERAQYKQFLLGSDWSNGEAMVAKINSFIGTKKRVIESQIKNTANEHRLLSALRYSRMYHNRIKEGEVLGTEGKVPDSEGTITIPPTNQARPTGIDFGSMLIKE